MDQAYGGYDEYSQDNEPRQERITGTVESVTFQNPDNGYTVLSLLCDDGEEVTVVGTLAGGAPGETLQLAGRWVQHREYGRQFEAAACSYHLPESTADIERYLGSGVLPGIGPATAKRIVRQFGEESLELLARAPERLAEVRGFSPEKAREAGRRFMEIFGLREAMISLGRLGLDAHESVQVYRLFGAHTMEMVAQNPYRLCAYPLYISFARADAIAHAMEYAPGSRQRARAALIYTLRHNLGNGHTCVPRDKLLETVTGFFAIEPEQAELELAAACEAGETQQVEYGGRAFLYLAEPFRAEMGAALRVRTLAALPSAAPPRLEALLAAQEEAGGMQYAPMQKKAILTALESNAMVITGGPGTGKTTAVNAIIALYESQAERVLLAAPTGRAAKRMSELTRRKAATIHRLLEVDFSGGEEFPRFKRNDKNPLRCDVLIVDEMSMVDAFLFESLLTALRPGCRLVMVGDADQLPSVGPGNVLRGIIDSGVVPVVELREIFRQAASSLIVKNAHRIVAGALPEAGTREDDYFFIKAAGSACQHLVCELAAQRLPAGYGLDPLTGIQVLCPGRKGPLGTEALNARLQQLINPPAADKPEIKRMDRVLRLGDKVMQVRNNYDIPYTRTDGAPGAGAFNGDIGVITRVNPKVGALTVLCDDRHVEYAAENLHELDIAYAITIHKSQGSEFEAIIIPLSEVPARLQYRNLLYTGVTRAKRVCVLAGEERILEAMVRAGNKNRRFSCFSEFLKDEALI